MSKLTKSRPGLSSAGVKRKGPNGLVGEGGLVRIIKSDSVPGGPQQVKMKVRGELGLGHARNLVDRLVTRDV